MKDIVLVLSPKQFQAIEKTLACTIDRRRDLQKKLSETLDSFIDAGGLVTGPNTVQVLSEKINDMEVEIRERELLLEQYRKSIVTEEEIKQSLS